MSFFTVDITLTAKGLENYEQVIEAAFKYFKRISEAGPNEQFAKELRDVGNMRFMFADKKDAVNTCSDLARNMPQFNDENIDQLVRSKFTADEFDLEKTKEIAADFSNLEKLNIIMRSKSFEGKTDKEDEWFKTKYSIEDLPASLKEKMENPNSDESAKKLDLPP